MITDLITFAARPEPRPMIAIERATDCCTALWRNQTITAMDAISIIAAAIEAAEQAAREKLEQELEKISFLVEPHHRGATGRRMNADEIVDYIIGIGKERTDAEREARSVALEEAAAVCKARAAQRHAQAPHLYSGIDYDGLALENSHAAAAIRALSAAPVAGETRSE